MSLGDVVARYKRARGFTVMHPMGWDAFGLPAENAAMERGVHPKGWTYQNIATMRAELKRWACRSTGRANSPPATLLYYGQQQAWFLELLKRRPGLSQGGLVNWDPVDNTVLANEQVIDGRGWRSGALVEKRKLNQWFLRITDYADELIDGLKTLDRWPDKVRLMQENWIGRSKGLRCASTWPDAPVAAVEQAWRSTPPGPTPCSAPAFVGIAAEHPLAEPPPPREDPKIAAFVAEAAASAPPRPRSSRPRSAASTPA
jgi:leucyl-tRNA synthetase